MNKRIGIVMAAPPAYSETFLNSKIRNLMDSGADITVFTRGKRGSYFFKHRVAPPGNVLMGLYIIPVLLHLYITAPAVMFRLLALCRKEHINIAGYLKLAYFNAHIISGKPQLLHYEFSALAHGREILAAALKAEMTVSLRGYDISIYPLKNPDCFSRMVKYLDKVHSISTYFIQRISSYGLSGDVSIYKIPPAVNTEYFSISPSAGQIATIPKILTIGRLLWKKGNEYAIRAAADLRDRGVKFEWHFIGEGQDTEMMRYLIRWYQLENFIYLHGKVPHDQMPHLIEQSNIYIQPSVQEGFCNAVLEAQSSGLLTIVTDAEGLPENVLHRITGLVVPRRNPSAMADAVMELLGMDESSRVRMAQTAASRVRKEFDLKGQQKAFNEFYGI